MHMATIVARVQERRVATDVSNVLLYVSFLFSSYICSLSTRKLHDVQKTIESFEDRLWDLEEHVMGEKLDDGNVYVRRRRDRSSRDS